ncbi:Protein obstructor-E [Nymphon striatum]|nr:Protein obstructor-E [Nymphon striatum]
MAASTSLHVGDFPLNDKINPVAIDLIMTSAEVKRLFKAASVQNMCPESEGLFPHPTDCSKYINCYKSHATIQQCPNCYVFNGTNNYCDFPENVDCSGKSIATPVLSNECPGCFGLFQDPVNCSIFYNCIGGKGILQACPHGLYFNDETQACDFDTVVGCPNSEDEGFLFGLYVIGTMLAHLGHSHFEDS